MQQAEEHHLTAIGVLGNKTNLQQQNTEDLQDILYPWAQQNWCIVTGKCSSRNASSIKYFLKMPF